MYHVAKLLYFFVGQPVDGRKKDTEDEGKVDEDGEDDEGSVDWKDETSEKEDEEGSNGGASLFLYTTFCYEPHVDCLFWDYSSYR